MVPKKGCQITHPKKRLSGTPTWRSRYGDLYVHIMYIYLYIYIYILGGLASQKTVTTKILSFISYTYQICNSKAKKMYIYIYERYTWEISTYLKDSSTKKRSFYPNQINQLLLSIKPSHDVDILGPTSPSLPVAQGTTRQVQYQVVTWKKQLFDVEKTSTFLLSNAFFLDIYPKVL